MAATQLILLERVEHLGAMGAIVHVKPGYARNYLLPQRKAIRATRSNLDLFAQQRAQLETQNIKRREAAERLAERVEGLSVIIIRQAGENGGLYGSVTARDIMDACCSSGLAVTRQQVQLDQKIRALGISMARIRLHPEVTISVTVNVARSVEEAERQARGESERPDEDVEDRHSSTASVRAPAPPISLNMLPDLLSQLHQNEEAVRTQALRKLAKFLLGEQIAEQPEVNPMQSSLRSIPGKLLDALIRDADSEEAGRAAAVALACFLAPERYRGTDLTLVDEADFALTIQQAFRARGLGYFSVVNVTDRTAKDIKVHAALRDSFGFRLGGQSLKLDPPDWLDREKGLEILPYGLKINGLVSVPTSALPLGTLAACTARLSLELNGPERVSIYLRNGETVFDRFLYSAAELFHSP